MSRILAIDPGQKLGWTHGEPGGKAISGVFKLTGSTRGRKLLSLENWLVNMLRGNDITQVWIESPLNLQANSIDSIFSTAGIDTTIEKECSRAGASYDYIEVATWRSEFMRSPGAKTGITMAPKMTDEEMIALLVPSGDANAIWRLRQKPLEPKNKTEARRRWLKRRTMEECAKRGLDVETDDEADAMGIWAVVTGRIVKKAATPQFDLIGGLTI